MPLADGSLARADFTRAGQEDFGSGKIDTLGHDAMTSVPDRKAL
jgi:hypothetical protein